jgi:hypothetical protein
MSGEYKDDDPLPGQEEDHTFVTTYEPRKHQSTPLPPGAEECIKNELNRVEKYLDLTRTAQTPSTMKIRTQEQKFEELINSSPLAKIAALKEENRQRRIKTYLDTVEQSLTPPEEPHFLPPPPEDKDFEETPKE